ncbi:MAG: hypothetical protein ACLR7D_04490 [Lachnospira eligens]
MGLIEPEQARIWQIGLFSLNNTSTNLFLAMMGYVSYYANGIAGLSVRAYFSYSYGNENI